MAASIHGRASSSRIKIINLPNLMDENKLVRILRQQNVMCDDVRIAQVDGREVALVDFPSALLAERWMVSQNGVVKLALGHMSKMVFVDKKPNGATDYNPNPPRDYQSGAASARDNNEYEPHWPREGYGAGARGSYQATTRDAYRITDSPTRGKPTGFDDSRYSATRPRAYSPEPPKRSRFSADTRQDEYNQPTPSRAPLNKAPPPRARSPVASSRLPHQTVPEPDLPGTDQIGINPCNTVLLRGLDGLTDEQRILDSLAMITSLEPSNCYVMRNIVTMQSLGFGFMEFDSVANATKIVDYFNSRDPFEVDGKLLMVDFSKNTLKTIMASIERAKEIEAKRVETERKRQVEERQRQAERQRLEADRRRQESERQRQEMERQRQEGQRRAEEERKKEQERQNAANRAEIARKKAEQLLETYRNNLPPSIQTKKGPVIAPARAPQDDDPSTPYLRETFSGYLYDRDTGLYIEKERCMVPERYAFVGHSLANHLDLRIFDEKEIVPNGRLEDLVTVALRLLDSQPLKGRSVCFYFFFGVTDLVDVKQRPDYREVVIRESGDVLLISKLDWAVKTLKEKRILPLFCTFPPMSFAKHNQFILRSGITSSLDYRTKYPEFQLKLNEQVAKINTKIEEINCESGVITCQLSSKVFTKERTQMLLKDIYLKDGLHPTSTASTLMNVELAQNLRKMKQGKRSPDWLRKSMQVKSAGGISFSLKKKEDPLKPIPADQLIMSARKKDAEFRDNRSRRSRSRSGGRSRDRSRDRSLRDRRSRSSSYERRRRSRSNSRDNYRLRQSRFSHSRSRSDSRQRMSRPSPPRSDPRKSRFSDKPKLPIPPNAPIPPMGAMGDNLKKLVGAPPKHGLLPTPGLLGQQPSQHQAQNTSRQVPFPAAPGSSQPNNDDIETQARLMLMMSQQIQVQQQATQPSDEFMKAWNALLGGNKNAPPQPPVPSQPTQQPLLPVPGSNPAPAQLNMYQGNVPNFANSLQTLMRGAGPRANHPAARPMVRPFRAGWPRGW